MKKPKIIVLLLVCYIIMFSNGFRSNASPWENDEPPVLNVAQTRVLFGTTTTSTRDTLKGVPLFTPPDNQYIEEAINELEIGRYSSDYERCVIINDYLRNRLEYSYEAAENGIKHNRNPWFTYCLADNQAVCAGYVECFQKLCLSFGIECWYDVGYVNVNGKRVLHAWARVVIDNKSYWVDPTFNDQENKHVSNLYLMSEVPFDDRELDDEYETYWLSSDNYTIQKKEE